MDLCALSSSWDLSPMVWIRTFPSLTSSNARILLRSHRVNGRTKLYVFDATLCLPDQQPARHDVNGNSMNDSNQNDSDLMNNDLINDDLNGIDLNGIDLNGIDLNRIELNNIDLNNKDTLTATIKDLKGLYALFLSCTVSSPLLHHRFYSQLTFAFYSFRDAEIFNNSLTPTSKSFVYNITFLDQLRGSGSHIKSNLHQSLQGYTNLQVLTLEMCDWLGDLGQYQCWKEEFLLMLMRIQYQFPQLVKVACGQHEVNCGTFRLMAKDMETGEDEIEFDPKDEYRDLMEAMVALVERQKRFRARYYASRHGNR